MHYPGIYDGHGGRAIVDYLENALENTICQELKLQDDASIQERLTRYQFPPFSTSLLSLFLTPFHYYRAFLITDMNSRKLNITTSGATAVCALICSKELEGVAKKTLHVANVGDSRAVLVSSLIPGNTTQAPAKTACNYTATRLSFDHRAEDEAEQQRIKEAGGFITRNRVLGILAVSRSFGDHGMKDFVTGTHKISLINDAK